MRTAHRTTPATYFGTPAHSSAWMLANAQQHRPETVGSLFIAYRLTGNNLFREYGWNIFQAIETHCKVESGGYASIINVDAVPAEHEDKMETFLMVNSMWLRLRICADPAVLQSETLKYLYLLFEDDTVIPLSSKWQF